MVSSRLKAIGFLGLVLLGLYLYFKHRPSPVTDANRAAVSGVGPVLPKDDTAQVLINPRLHTVTIRRANGDVTTSHLPDTTTVIDVKKGGVTSVTAAQFGFETRPFVGLGFSDDARFALGVDGLYWKRLDLGGGVQLNFHMADPRAFVSLSYNVIDNLRITATVDHKKTAGVFLSLRI